MSFADFVNRITEGYLELYNSSTKFAIGQWVVIALIIFIVFFSYHKRKKIIKKNTIHLHSFRGPGKTDFDVLYDLLKYKKKVRMIDLIRAFKVEEPVVAEWADILENANKAMIEYPLFGKPVLRIIEDEEKVKKKSEEKGEVTNVKKVDEKKDVSKKISHNKKKIVKKPKISAKKKVKKITKKTKPSNKSNKKIKKVVRKAVKKSVKKRVVKKKTNKK